MNSYVAIRTMSADDWRIMREVRLRALLDSPTAFGSSYEDQSKLTDAQWIQKAATLTDPGSAGTFLAFVTGQPIGMAVVAPDRDNPKRGWVVSMWVAPKARGMGVGKQLIERLQERAQVVGYDELMLHVTDGNIPATRLYERMGFRMTGDTMPHPRIDGLLELEMRCALNR